MIRRLSQVRVRVLASFLAAGLLQCSGDLVAPGNRGEIEIVSGDGQTGRIGQPLPERLVVLVTDEVGSPASGVSVQWTAQNGGGVSAETVTTGANGEASVERVLGSGTGEQTTTASVAGLKGSPVTFLSVATDGQTPMLHVQQQPSTSAQSGVVLAVQPAIQLQNANGADVAQSGVAVTASLALGNGALGGTLTRSTNGSGEAAFTDLMITGAPGAYTLRFSAPGYIQAVSTSIQVTPVAGGLAITTNPPVTALSREVFDPATQPVIRVTDASGNPGADIEVTVRVASGTGTLEGVTRISAGADGNARFPDLGINGTGQHVLEFTAGSVKVSSSPISVTALSPQASTGSWGPVVNWDVVPLHMSLLPSGKILAWGKYESNGTSGSRPRLWTPSAGSPANAPSINVDTMLFCAGHTLMPDGRLMVSGGHKHDDVGINVTNFFGPDGAWQKGPNMAYGRWYPTVTVLPDGRVLTMGGRDENGVVVKIPEIWESGQWVQLPGASAVDIPYYPRNFVTPDGRIFYAGERVMSRWFNVDGTGTGGGRGSWSNGPSHIWAYNRDYGTAVMYEPGKILVAGGGGNTGWQQTPDAKASAPTATAEKIDVTQSSPTWQSAGSMSAPRRHLNSTILPDGQVLITGGTQGGGFVNISEANAVKTAELWNPATNQWTVLASNQIMRVYHSVSLLLPDGTVLHGASGNAMAGTVPVPDERNHEIFSPPYLFKGVRPTISSAPSSVGYGQTFTVGTANGGQITAVRWIRLGSVTHAFDMSQRANTLTFRRRSGGVDVTAPANSNLAPPGHYLLFILNRNGVPSAGSIIRIQ